MQGSEANSHLIQKQQQAKHPHSTVFDPALRTTLQAIRKKKHSNYLIKAERQYRQQNRYFEFQQIGDQRAVRINGHCFLVPAHEPLALVQKAWTLSGSCEKSKTWKLDLGKNTEDVKTR